MSNPTERWLYGDPETAVLEPVPPRRERRPWQMRRVRDALAVADLVMLAVPLLAIDVVTVRLALQALGVIR